MASVLVEGKVIGQRRPLFSDWHVPLPPEFETAGGRITLRALLTQVVLAEVAAFQQRRGERRLTQVLSREQIEAGAARGKIDMGGRESEPDVDPQQAVDTALLAFQDGLFYVFVDEEQVTALEHEVFLRPHSRMMFLRLVALAGG